MGRRCRICGRERPHEHFGGRGQLAIVCKECRRLPPEVRRRELLVQEISDFLDQSNISENNIKRLSLLEADEISEVASLANVVKRIAQAHPRKRKRWNVLRHQHRELFQSAVDVGLFEYVESNLGCDTYDESCSTELEFVNHELTYHWLVRQQQELDLDGDYDPEQCDSEPLYREIDDFEALVREDTDWLF